MQFIYRGIPYQYNTPKLVDAKQQTNLKYCAISQLAQAKKTKIADIHVLKYRGIEFIKVLSH